MKNIVEANVITSSSNEYGNNLLFLVERVDQYIVVFHRIARTCYFIAGTQSFTCVPLWSETTTMSADNAAALL